MGWVPSEHQLRWRIKPLVFLAGLLPLFWYSGSFVMNQLGANPIEAVTRGSGDWALRFILITLTITPLRRLTGSPVWLKLRRMLGLFAFFYAFIHFLTYVWLDQFFYWEDIWADIVERPFITVGFMAFILLIPLAATSTKAMMRRLKRRWGKLHRLIYLIAIAALLHFWWMKSSKSDVIEPVVYGVILAFLLGFRVSGWIKKRRPWMDRSARKQISS